MRRTSRGSQRGRVTLIYILIRPEWARWLRFEPIDANALFHSDQGWGAELPLAISRRDFLHHAVIALDNADDLIEEYSGFALRLESRRLGTERLGIFFEWSTYDQDWRDATLAALALNPQIPACIATGCRHAALEVRVHATGERRRRRRHHRTRSADRAALPSQMANVAIGSVRLQAAMGRTSGLRRRRRDVHACAPGTTALESDFTYERYLARSRLRVPAR